MCKHGACAGDFTREVCAYFLVRTCSGARRVFIVHAGPVDLGVLRECLCTLHVVLYARVFKRFSMKMRSDAGARARARGRARARALACNGLITSYE